MPTSFSNDIAPIFGPFRGNMLWRFDLTDYEQVKANAAIIQVFITADPDSACLPRITPASFSPANHHVPAMDPRWLPATFQHGSVQNDATRLKRRM